MLQRWLILGRVALLLSALLASAQGHAQDPGGRIGNVVHVVDGDTIDVRIGPSTQRVRYIGMNAPEPNQPGGREATEANRGLVGGQTVRLELDVQEQDRYRRLLAYVYVGDMLVNAELVAQGYAQVMTIPPNVRHQDLFVRLQREARLLQLGLWRDTGPPPPGSSPSPAPRHAPLLPPAVSKQVVERPQGRPGVPPQDDWTCPPAQPIKGNFTTYSGERCIFHPPGGEFYSRTKPERCYASGGEAVQDGCRASRR